MSLGAEQRRFTLAIGRLIVYAYGCGYELTFGDAYRDPRVFGEVGEKAGYGNKNSVHKVRLAVDLNLFVRGEYITDSTHPAWYCLHNKWTLLGGADMINEDANHFSFEYAGMR